jgi:hypothetical protein
MPVFFNSGFRFLLFFCKLLLQTVDEPNKYCFCGFENTSQNLKSRMGEHNQNHQLSWWYALCLEGINTGSPTRALNEIYIRIKFTGYC